MVLRKWITQSLCVIAAVSLISCKPANRNSSSGSSANSPAATVEPDRGETGVEKVKPAPGTGNVQGKVLFNGKPVENIEVKLCETFNRFLGGCGGKTYTARTDKEGDYVITNVPPKVYEGLLAKVFETDSYVFATTGFAGLSSNKYEVTADKTLFASPTNLFKGDLKLLNPKAGAKVSAQNLELKWESYPDAAYYKFSIFADDASVTSPYVNQRVEGTSFSLDKPLEKGVYRWQVEAFNSSDKKLSESSNEINFTIN
jgi:hypothetical protein